MGSTEVLSPEERVERVRMALAEAGYPDARVSFSDSGVAIAMDLNGGPPREVAWRALAISAPPEMQIICWPCSTIGAWPCDHDFRTEPWPPTPSLLSADQETP